MFWLCCLFLISVYVWIVGCFNLKICIINFVSLLFEISGNLYFLFLGIIGMSFFCIFIISKFNFVICFVFFVLLLLIIVGGLIIESG